MAKNNKTTSFRYINIGFPPNYSVKGNESSIGNKFTASVSKLFNKIYLFFSNKIFFILL